MRVAMLEDMKSVFDFPVYVFTQVGETIYADKITVEEKKTVRDRYILTAGQQCTCLGFLKFKHCKHLKMWKNESLDCAGVPSSKAVWIAREVVQKLKDKGIVSDCPLIDGDSLPEIITGIVITVEKFEKGLKKIACVKKTEVGDMELVVEVKNS